MEKTNQAYIIMYMGAKLKAIIQILEEKGITTRKEIEKLEVKLIHKGLKEM